MYDEKAEAYAVIENDKIDVRTVSETRRAAIVNWLVVNRGVWISRTTTDEQIERFWDEHGKDVTVAAVEINRALPLI